MSSLSKLIQLWNKDRFVPGGQPVSDSLLSDNEIKRERCTKLHHDRTIVRDIRDGIAILGHAVDGLEKTQEFNRDPSAFKGNTREILMSDDFLMVAHVLRLIFPEDMMSEVRPRKRGRDEVDDDDDNNNHEEGGTRKYRPLLTPKGPSQLVSRPKQGPYTGGLFKSTKPGHTGITFSFSDLKTDEQPGYHTSSTSDSNPALSSGVLSKRKSLFSTAEKPLKEGSLFSSPSLTSSEKPLFAEKPLKEGPLFSSPSLTSSEKPLFAEKQLKEGPSLFRPFFSSTGFNSSGLTSSEKPLFTEKPLKEGPGSLQPSFAGSGFSTSDIGSADKPLPTGGLSSFKPGFSSLGFGSSGIGSADTDSLGSKEIYEQTQLLTGPSFSDLRLTNEDKIPGLGEPHGQTFKRGHEEELEVAVKARKGGNQERFKLETPQDLILF